MRKETFAAVLGGANMDIFAKPSIPVRRGDSVPGQIMVSPGGVARNVAENLVLLSVPVRLFTAFGDDRFGRMLRDSCSSLGIDASSSLSVPGRNSGAYVSVQDEDGDAAAGIASMDVLDSIVPATIRDWEKRIAGASCIVADANLSAETIAELVSRFASAPIILDPSSRTKALRVIGSLRGIRAIKPNLEEAEVLCGFRIRGRSGLRAAAERLHDAGVRSAFISLGQEGAFYSGRDTADGAGTVPACPSLEVRNANGAGDAFTAGIAWGIMNELALRDTARFASALAALTMESDEAVNRTISVGKVRSLMEATR